MPALPLVSVIVPNYNHARYLGQRLDSILNQTYRNIEVIILDDCSTDNSLEVINKHKENSRISQIAVNEVNTGSTFCQWKKGIQLARGEWVWIAESDDYCRANFLEEMLKALQNDAKSVIVASNSEWVDENGKSILRYSTLEAPVVVYSGRDFIRKRMVYDNDIPNASAAIFHRQAALSIPDDYMSFKAAGDRLFWIYMSQKGNVVRVNQFLNFFRQHTNKVSPKRELDGTVFFEDRRIIDYAIRTGLLRGLDKQRSFLHFQSRAYQKEYISEQVRNEVYKAWDCDGKWGGFCFRVRRKSLYLLDKLNTRWAIH